MTITTHLWFDKEAEEAGQFYVSLFNGSKVRGRTTLHDTPSGSVDIVTIDLAGEGFTLISAGPLFKFTPAISFLVACDTRAEVDRLWKPLARGGAALMELGRYPFSPWYGWVQDRYGLSWQVMLAENRPTRQTIVPTLMFSGDVYGKAEEAIRSYTSVFRDAAIGDIVRYGDGEEPARKGTIKHAGFRLEGKQFAAMDSAGTHEFTFNEAISFMVHCRTQGEIDHYWDGLSARPEAEQCGWLKDRYGVSWQIVPTIMDEMLATRDKKKLARVTAAFLKMKKFDIAALERAFEGR